MAELRDLIVNARLRNGLVAAVAGADLRETAATR